MFWGFSTYINKKYKIEFQRKSLNDAALENCAEGEEIIFEEGEFIPIPNVGDNVSYIYGDGFTSSKVISKQLRHLKGWCIVNLVVTDISDEEMSAGLKE